MLKGPLALATKLMPKPQSVSVDATVSESSADAMPSDLTVVDTPGHTPGHTSYLLDRGAGVIFVGDAALANKSGAVTRGFMNLGGGDLIDASIRHIATFTFGVAVFGHSDPIEAKASDAFGEFSRS
jgi:glyoxylase-like metal-dependent hydrolase (beta-lactamase superfamily II)